MLPDNELPSRSSVRTPPPPAPPPGERCCLSQFNLHHPGSFAPSSASLHRLLPGAHVHPCNFPLHLTPSSYFSGAFHSHREIFLRFNFPELKFAKARRVFAGLSVENFHSPDSSLQPSDLCQKLHPFASGKCDEILSRKVCNNIEFLVVNVWARSLGALHVFNLHRRWFSSLLAALGAKGLHLRLHSKPQGQKRSEIPRQAILTFPSCVIASFTSEIRSDIVCNSFP